MEITQEQGIILKEYGRNVQNIVDYTLTIEDREKRTRFAKTIIELMKQINPSMRDAQDSYQKLWDHLYLMSGFKLDVDSPYPMPEVSVLGKKPMKVEYNTHNLNFKHYGRNIELMIENAKKIEDPAEKEAAVMYIGKLMKRFYSAWNKENIEDEIIIEHMRRMSNNSFDLDVDKIKSGNLFDSSQREYRDNRSSDRGDRNTGRESSGGGYKGKPKRPDNKRRNNN